VFKVRHRPRKISAKKFVKSLLTNDYKWKYPEAKLLVKILLANKFLPEAIKRELKLERCFACPAAVAKTNRWTGKRPSSCILSTQTLGKEL
jgi:hypothetical protein